MMAPSAHDLMAAVDDLWLYAGVNPDLLRPSTVVTCQSVHEFLAAMAQVEPGEEAYPDDPGLLTTEERLALDLTSALGRSLHGLVDGGRDRDELVSALHVIQRAIGAQAAARAYPAAYRLLYPPGVNAEEPT